MSSRIIKSARRRRPVGRTRFIKHGGDSHDQKDHGNWARGGGVPERPDLKPTVNPSPSDISGQLKLWVGVGSGIGFPPIPQSSFTLTADRMVDGIVMKARPDLASPEWVAKVEEGVAQFAETPALQALFDRYGLPLIVPSALEGISGETSEDSGVLGQHIGGVILVPENESHILTDPPPRPMSHEDIFESLISGQTQHGEHAVTMAHTLRHEYGHYVMELLMFEGRGVSTAPDATEAEQHVGPVIAAKLEAARIMAGGDVYEWETEGFGSYPMSNYKEFGAEAFAIVTHPEYGPDIRAQYGASYQRVLDMVQRWITV